MQRRGFLKGSGLALAGLSMGPLAAGAADAQASSASSNMMMINIPEYARMLLESFFAAGGDLVTREFRDARDFREIPEKTIIHSTGYAARALVKDDSLVPVRGRTARLIPQPEVDYAISYEAQNVYTVSRRDGMIVQSWEHGDYGSAIEAPDLALTKTTLARLAKLFA